MATDDSCDPSAQPDKLEHNPGPWWQLQQGNQYTAVRTSHFREAGIRPPYGS